MHRRDYEVIASVLERNHDKFKSNTAHAKLAAEIGLELWRDNPRFDPGRFMWAAMPKAWRGTRKANVWERTVRSLRALTARGGAIDRAVHNE